MTVKEFLTRYDNKEVFNEDELKDLYWGDIEASDGMEFEEIDEEVEDKRRWRQFIYKYVMIGGRYFCLTADIGLTEYQDNVYDYQPEEVRRTQKTIVVDCWEPI